MAALLNGRKIQILLQLMDAELTWRVASMAYWTLLTWFHVQLDQKIFKGL